MNESAREYLVSVVREETIVSYSQFVEENRLKIDLNSDLGQQQLKDVLETISKYEHQHGRLMLTAVVVKKGKNDQGNGFYDLAERLNFGTQ